MFKLLLYVDVFRSGKIPESLYTVYEQQCKKMTAEILEGSMLRVFCVYTCIIVYIYIYIYISLQLVSSQWRPIQLMFTTDNAACYDSSKPGHSRNINTNHCHDISVVPKSHYLKCTALLVAHGVGLD